MKKIIPFNNVLEFNTDVKEITAISLEHDINKTPDMINGTFYISGEYKITEGVFDKEKFNFELPFDIALSNNYKTDTLLIDIDDFRYDLITDKNLKINIDLYIDGEIEEPIPIIKDEESLAFLDREEKLINQTDKEEIIEKEEESILKEETKKEEFKQKETKEEKIKQLEIIKTKEEINEESFDIERIDLLKEMLTETKEKEKKENKEEEMAENTNNQNNNINIFETNQDDNYVTYRVYKVEENTTIDTILKKYNITKEQLADYNNIENINQGDKLIIPTNEK